MYLRHFGLREFPFGITPDTSFFFGSGCSQEALNTLLIAVRTGEGFIKITGEVGTGKTLLCRKLISSLEPDFQVAYIPNPYLDPVALFTELSSELGQEVDLSAGQTQHVYEGATRPGLFRARQQLGYLSAQAGNNRRYAYAHVNAGVSQFLHGFETGAG